MMKHFFLSVAGLACLCLTAEAQKKDELFGTEKQAAGTHSGFVIGMNGSFDIPGADMAQRFGLSYRVGPSLFYKTKNNWLVGAKLDFLFGGKVKEDSLMHNIRNADGSFIDETGILKTAGIFERGYAASVQAGKIFAFSSERPESGLLLLTGAGFIQHKILVVDKDNSIIPIKGREKKKGYDRLSNGIFVEQFAGFNHFGPSGFFNYHIGINILAGFTQGRRDYLYDVMRPGTDKRFDLLFGIRGGWYIPIFKRKSEEMFF